MQNNTLSYRVGQLEKQVDEVESRIDEIRTNHLPHLTEEITSLKTRINVLSVINIGAIIAGIVIANAFK